MVMGCCFFCSVRNYAISFFLKKPVPDHRRKWDKDEYEKIVAERLEEEERKALERQLSKEAPVRREMLKPRDYKVNKWFQFYEANEKTSYKQ